MKIKNLFFPLTVLLLSLSMLSFVSCNDDDEDKETSSEIVDATSNIVGTWMCIGNKGWETWDGGEESWENDELGLVLNFQEDGTGVMNDDGNTELFKWSIKGDKLRISFIEDGYQETETLTIKTLNTESLVVEYHDKDGKYETWSQETFKRLK